MANIASIFLKDLQTAVFCTEKIILTRLLCNKPHVFLSPGKEDGFRGIEIDGQDLVIKLHPPVISLIYKNYPVLHIYIIGHFRICSF